MAEIVKVPKRELKPSWRKDGMDWICDLGDIKKAIVVAYYVPIFDINYYAISPRSFLPFNNVQHGRKFDDYYNCCVYAESIILDWIKSLMVEEQPVKSLDDIAKTLPR